MTTRASAPQRFNLKRALASLAAAAVVAGGLLAVAPPAMAAEGSSPAELLQRNDDVVTADALPTVQIDDGYVWAQATIGNTVYAAGSFTNARAAGAAPGTSLTPRSNILAFDIRTGNLLPFAPQVNGVIKSIVASPDGSRIYIGGSFNQVNGASRWNFAALNATTGELVPGFSPSIGGTGVYALAATGDAIYLGGKFTQANGTPRSNLAAFSATNGALLSWAPTTDLQVDAMVMEPGNQKVIAGGRFYTVNGVGGQTRGIVALDPATGATVPWAVTSVIKNGLATGSTAGRAGIFALAADTAGVYGTGWVYADVNTGNVEGTFAVDAGAGELRWLADCHGDHYGVWSTGKTVYSTSHTHECDTVGLWPEQPSRQYRYVEAYTAEARGTLTRTPSESSIYKNWAGTPSPSAYTWYPDFTVGNTSGLGQAGLSITGAGDFISVAGEFGSVNNQRFQGIVRFSTKPSSGAKQGGRIATADWTPSARSVKAGEVRVQIPANWDRDDMNLTYELRREGTSQPVATTTAASMWWKRPTVVLKDTNAVAGQTYTYRVVAKDADNNSVTSSPVSVTVSTQSASDYVTSVLDDGATHYWPLDEASGTGAADWAGTSDLTVNNATRNQDGQNLTTPNKATRFLGNSSSFATSTVGENGPQNFTVEAWVKTNSTQGGKIVGFGNSSTGTSGSYDRHLYMSNNGRITFGVYPGAVRTIETGTGYNNNQWHHIVGTLSSEGMALYVDGVLVGARVDTTSAQDYTGVWRIGGDNTGGWTNAGSSAFLNGTIADVAVYPTALDGAAVLEHYSAAGRGETKPNAPADAYGSAVYQAGASLFWRLDETTGTRANDAGPGTVRMHGTYFGNTAKNQAGAIATGGRSITLNPITQAQTGVTSDRAVFNPKTFTVETWFKTTSTAGGKLIGLGDKRTGLSDNYDRHVYMGTDGSVKFGVWNGVADVLQTGPGYNDGQWHHVVASMSSNGMRLYLDGVLQGSNSVTTAQVYAGYWRIGGDSGWEGANYWTGSLDEFAVYPVALTPAQVASHYTIGSGTVPVNQPPIDVDFTASVDGLSVDFVGTGTDPEEGELAYSWSFGGGATATGATTSHTFPATGDYEVTLTVTDDQGGQTSKVKTVSVVHAAPEARFDVDTDALTVEVDASASTASDGATLSYSWNWGDGSPAGSGEQATHTYEEDGEYEITLTVTDSLGASATAEETVEVAAPPAVDYVALDTFDRTVSGGWGAANKGGSWTVASGTTSVLSVDGSKGVISLPAGQTRNMLLPGASVRDSETNVRYEFSAPPSDGAKYVGVGSRRVGSSNYFVRVWHRDTGAVWLVAQSGSTVITSKTVSGLTWSAGTTYQVKTEVSGVSPTTIRAKIWPAGSAEPTAWQLETTDSTPALQAAGGAVLQFARAASAGSASSVKFDDITVRDLNGGPVANVPPVASFTSSVSGLKVDVDGSGSSDDDGTVESYSWNWGDGSAASSGATASHTYSGAGTFDVVLTVTDDDGATHAVTKSVTVSAPTANVPPVASFTSSVSGLRVDVDGSGSSDDDGTVESYSWNWGDGSAPSSGATASHTYSGAGTFDVVLTVTDDDGATHSVTKSVTVTAAPTGDFLLRDGFQRTTTAGWGQADVGGAWTISSGSAAAASVTDGTARLDLAASGTRTALLTQTPLRNFVAEIDFSANQNADTGASYVGFVPRHNGSSYYIVNAWLRTDGRVWLTAQLGSTVLQTATSTGLTYAAGDEFTLKVEAAGPAGTTELRAKIWRKGAEEPSNWQLSASDSTSALQNAASVGIRANRTGSSTTAVALTFDRFEVRPLD